MSECVWVKIYRTGGPLFYDYPRSCYETSCKTIFRHYDNFKLCPGCGNPFILDTKKHDKELEQWEKDHVLKTQEEEREGRFKQGSYDCMGGNDSLLNRRMCP